MSTQDRVAHLEAWIGNMVETQGRPESESTLVRAIQDTVSAHALALWREVAIGSETRWTQVRARGPEQLLPDESQVRAVLEAGLDGRLGEGQRVICAGQGLSRLALAIGCASLSEDDLDRAEALLAVHVSLVPGNEGNESVPAALPARDRTSPIPDPLLAARSVIAAEVALFANRSIGLTTRGFDKARPCIKLDPEELASLVRELLLHARHTCGTIQTHLCSVQLELGRSTWGILLALEVNSTAVLQASPFASNAMRACVRRAAGSLSVSQPNRRSQRVQIWLPGDLNM